MTNEELAKALYTVADCVMYYHRISQLNDCNNCGKKLNCEHLPEWGDNVRINCFAWESKQDDEQ